MRGEANFEEMLEDWHPEESEAVKRSSRSYFPADFEKICFLTTLIAGNYNGIIKDVEEDSS